jgi:hypothetical protein
VNTHEPEPLLLAPPITRTQALEIGIAHVTKVATNARGFMDGASFRERAEFAERYARFLIGEDE